MYNHNSHVLVDGQFVSAKVQQIVQAIKDYEPTLEVKWIPPSARTEGEAAYGVWHNPPGQPAYCMFYVQNDEDFDERVLQRIIFNDQRNAAVQFSELEAWEKTQELAAKQRYLDSIEEANDIAASVLRSPLNKYRVNKNLTIRD